MLDKKQVSGERIVFVELWRLGDTIAATAGLRALRLTHPDASITVLAHSAYGDPLFRSPDKDAALAFDAFWTRGKTARDKYLPWTVDYGHLHRARRALAALRPDTVLLFRGDPREQLFFASLFGYSRVIDARRQFRTVPGIRIFPGISGVPRHVEYVDLVQRWSGVDVHASPHLAGVRRTGNSHSYVVVHPGASWKFKQWNADRMAGLVRYIANAGREPVLAGDSNDADFIRSVASRSGCRPRVVFTTLEEFYTLVAEAAAVVCNNSAALHVAEALGTPCIALTGSADPVRWGTYRSHSVTLVRSVGLKCHPCGEKRCVRPKNPCIDDITLPEVITTLEAVLGDEPASASMPLQSSA